LFHPSPFAYIQGRNAHQALDALITLHHHGLRNVLDADIAGFFDNLRHQVIMSAVAGEVMLVNMGNQPHDDDGEGLAFACPLPAD